MARKKGKKQRRTGVDTNLATEYFVASQLARQGYRVEVTRGHLPEIDLFVAHKEQMVTLDVKGVRDKTNWPVHAVNVRPNHFYVFVAYDGKFEDLDKMPPSVFVVPSADVEPMVEDWKMPGVKHRTLRESQYQDAWHLLFGEKPGKRRGKRIKKERKR